MADHLVDTPALYWFLTANSRLGANARVVMQAAWRFLALQGAVVTLDRPEYPIDNPGKIMGILAWLVRGSGPEAMRGHKDER